MIKVPLQEKDIIMNKEELSESKFYLIVYTDGIMFEDDDEIIGAPKRHQEIEE